MTIDTFTRFDHFGRMIAFAVETGRKGKDIPGTILNTVTASLAPVLNDTDSAFGNLNYVRVKRNTPEFHLSALYPG